mmetsp:Transcript_17877/g.30835  ORF Transcript_17877/g.30835 Transcript_17877/m.30835 type:complete len:399 (+) Transcript_17877:741-1937(+)
MRCGCVRTAGKAPLRFSFCLDGGDDGVGHAVEGKDLGLQVDAPQYALARPRRLGADGHDLDLVQDVVRAAVLHLDPVAEVGAGDDLEALGVGAEGAVEHVHPVRHRLAARERHKVHQPVQQHLDRLCRHACRAPRLVGRNLGYDGAQGGHLLHEHVPAAALDAREQHAHAVQVLAVREVGHERVGVEVGRDELRREAPAADEALGFLAHHGDVDAREALLDNCVGAQVACRPGLAQGACLMKENEAAEGVVHGIGGGEDKPRVRGEALQGVVERGEVGRRTDLQARHLNDLSAESEKHGGEVAGLGYRPGHHDRLVQQRLWRLWLRDVQRGPTGLGAGHVRDGRLLWAQVVAEGDHVADDDHAGRQRLADGLLHDGFERPDPHLLGSGPRRFYCRDRS